MGCRSGQSERVSRLSCGVSRDDGNTKVAGAKLSRRLLYPENLGWSLHGRKTPITGKGLIEMLDKRLEQEQAPRVDERLARVVRMIVEQYDGDVKAFVESNRYRTEVNRKAEVASDHGDEAPLRKCPSTTKIIGRISSAHYS
jgi:hypothetical protein